MHTDLLEGKIKPQLLRLALPLFLGSILQQLYNTVDSLVVGHFLGTEAFASTGVSGTLMNLFIFVLNGFCVGSSILFGHKYGAGDKKGFRQSVFTALAAGVVITAVFSVGSIALLPMLLRLIQTPTELIGYCTSYLRIILGGLIFTFLYNLFAAVLRSMGDTKAALVFLFIAAFLNTLLDVTFIVFLHSGVAGAAAATIIAQGIAALCCCIYMKRRYPDYTVRKEDVGYYPDIIKAALKLGSVTALHQSSLYFGKLLVQGAVNTLGTSGIAAFTAATRIEGVLGSFGDSGGQAISIHISQNAGAGNHKRIKEALIKGMGINHAVCLVLILISYIFAAPIINLFLNGNDPYALQEGVKYLRLVCYFYILAFSGYSYVGYFRGTGHVLIPFLATTTQLTCRVVFSYILIASLGLAAVGYATGIGWILNTILHTALFFVTMKKDAAKYA